MVYIALSAKAFENRYQDFALCVLQREVFKIHLVFVRICCAGSADQNIRGFFRNDADCGAAGLALKLILPDACGCI